MDDKELRREGIARKQAQAVRGANMFFAVEGKLVVDGRCASP